MHNAFKRNSLALICCGVLVPAASAGTSPAMLEITAPLGGEAWCADSLHHVTWKNAGPPTASWQLAYSTDDGKSWADLGKVAAGAGKFLWKVPAKISPSCRLRLSTAGGATTQSKGLFSIIASQEVKDYQWVKITDKAPFAPRDGAGALVFQGKMWLLGGWNPGDKKFFPRICNNEVWNSSDGKNWTLVKGNTFLDLKFDPLQDWEGRHTAGYVVFKERMWIVGGDANQGHYQDDVWNSADGKNWVLINKKAPWAPRALHYTVAFKDKIWVLGGQTMAGFAGAPEVFYNDIWASVDGVDWKQVTPKGPHWSPRGMISGSVVFKDRIWLLGGGTYDTPKVKFRNFYNDVWSSADGVSWTQHGGNPPWPPRQYHDVAVFDGRMWVMEGYAQPGGNRNDVWYSADGVNWYELPGTPWAPRHAASVFVHDGALWMVAGNNMTSDVWKLVRGGAGK